MVRFYVDADILGLAKVLASLRADVTYPGDPGDVIHKEHRNPCPILPGAKDLDWIPKVCKNGWLIIARDSAIQRWPLEIAASSTTAAAWLLCPGATPRPSGTSSRSS